MAQDPQAVHDGVSRASQEGQFHQVRDSRLGAVGSPLPFDVIVVDDQHRCPGRGPIGLGGHCPRLGTGGLDCSAYSGLLPVVVPARSAAADRRGPPQALPADWTTETPCRPAPRGSPRAAGCGPRWCYRRPGPPGPVMVRSGARCPIPPGVRSEPSPPAPSRSRRGTGSRRSAAGSSARPVDAATHLGAMAVSYSSGRCRGLR